MSCRWTRGNSSSPEVVNDARTGAIYLELVRACRKEDFLWLARSQGVPPHLVDELWQRLRARLGTDRPSA